MANDPSSSSESAAEWVPIERLRPWIDNPRVNDAAVEKVARSIKRFGFGAPIVARRADGEVIAGHTRLKASAQLGLKKVPVRYLDLDPADAHLLSLADNKLNEAATWDDERLAELVKLMDQGDLLLAGFSDREIDALVGDFPDPFSDDEDDCDGEILDEGTEKITFKVLLVQAEKARAVLIAAMAEAGIKIEIA